MSDLERSLVEPTDEGIDDLFRALTGKEPEDDDHDDEDDHEDDPE